MANFRTFYGGRKQATTKFPLSFLDLRVVPKKSTPGKFTRFRHFQRIGINATKFEKTLMIHFKSDVFAAFAVVDAKIPSRFSEAPDENVVQNDLTGPAERIFMWGG